MVNYEGRAIPKNLKTMGEVDRASLPPSKYSITEMSRQHLLVRLCAGQAREWREVLWDISVPLTALTKFSFTTPEAETII